MGTLAGLSCGKRCGPYVDRLRLVHATGSDITVGFDSDRELNQPPHRRGGTKLKPAKLSKLAKAKLIEQLFAVVEGILIKQSKAGLKPIPEIAMVYEIELGSLLYER